MIDRHIKSLTVLILFLMLSSFVSSGTIPSDPLWGQYELRVMSGKDNGRLHSVMIYGGFGNESIYYNEDGQDVSRETRYNQYVYYKPASGATYTYQEPLEQIPQLLEGTEIVDAMGGAVRYVDRTVYQPGDTLIVEAQTNGIGSYVVVIEVERTDGVKVEIRKEANASEFAQNTAAIAEYTVSGQDKCIRIRSDFSLDDAKKEKPVKRSFSFHIDVGSLHRHFNLISLTLTVMIPALLAAAIIIIRSIRRNRSDDRQ